MTDERRYTDKEITDSNIVFHDQFDAKVYDAKWGKRYSADEMQTIVSEYAHYLGGPVGEIGRYLDIGCGTGSAVVNLSLYPGTGSAHGSDISLGMLLSCRENARSAGGSVTLAVSDAGRLPYADDAFDFVTCHAVLHHVARPGEVLKEIHRVLAPGGRALVFEPTRYGTALCFRLMRLTWGVVWGIRERLKGKKPIWVVEEEFVEGLSAPPDLTTFYPSELRRLLDGVPFADKKVVTYGFLGNLLRWFSHPARKIRPIGWLADGAARFLTYLDEKVLKWVVPETLYFQAVITLKK
jgi:ubiquinone/menaquinone biosynthesis C-methylase UbiE